MKQILLKRKYVRILPILLFFLAITTINTKAQVTEPIDMILVENAPHLPWIQRSESTENVFKGEKFNYGLEDNNSKINQWLESYPDEFQAYQTAMDDFFKTKTPEDFSESDRDFYYDMKAQYQMIKDLKPW